MGPHLGRAPLVRMMMRMMRFRLPCLMGGIARCLLVVALPVLRGLPLRWRRGETVAVAATPPGATSVEDLEVMEEDMVSVGMEVHPSLSPRLPGVVCYSRSLGSPLPQPWGPRTWSRLRPWTWLW